MEPEHNLSETERRIVSNGFIDKIRELVFDEAAYEQLSADLQTLEQEWAGADTISKRVAAELFIIPIVVWGAAERPPEALAADAERARLVAAELETLVFRCFVPHQ